MANAVMVTTGLAILVLVGWMAKAFFLAAADTAVFPHTGRCSDSRRSHSPGYRYKRQAETEQKG